MARILPGVEIKVVKEIVAPAVTPSGVLGLTGITDRGVVEEPTPVSSWPAFLEIFGPASAYSMPEAKQAIMNGVFELVVVRVDGEGASKAAIGLTSADGTEVVRLQARAEGTWANDLAASVKENKDSSGNVVNIDLTLTHGETSEAFSGLVMVPGDAKYLFDVINSDSTLVTAIDPVRMTSLPAPLVQTDFVVYDADARPDEAAAHLYLPNTAGGDDYVLKLEARARGAAGNDLDLKARLTEGTEGNTISLRIYRGTRIAEEYENMTMNPDDPNYLVFAINNNSKSLVKALDLYEPTRGSLPAAGEYVILDTDLGTDPDEGKFTDGIDKLEAMPNVDMVMASLPAAFYGEDNETATVHAHINAHCLRMSDEAKNRIGLGTVSAGENDDTGASADRAIALASDRFVLVAPHGVLGAVAGLIGSLTYYESPTFKRISGVPGLEYNYSPSQLRSLVQANVLAIELQRGRGIVVEKGISTSGEQISVTRVADHAVRGVKGIADLFIGTLNTEDGRMALKQKITELFLGMEKEGAIVPSADGIEPSFKVDVYSSEQDFGQGIVRVDIAVRPVRAIDYIYATITVEV
jgi:hypothetical protein